MVERHIKRDKSTTQGSAKTQRGAQAPCRGEAKRGIFDRVVRHRSLYMGLYGWHLFAAVQTGKPEVYGPMAVLYLLLALKG